MAGLSAITDRDLESSEINSGGGMNISVQLIHHCGSQKKNQQKSGRQ